MHHGRAPELVCGELLILGKSVIRHTQVSDRSRSAFLIRSPPQKALALQ